MSRVEIASQPWGVLQDRFGNALQTVVSIKNLDGSAATHYSAVTGGTSSTSDLTSDSNGTLGRFIEDGQYTIDVPAIGVTGRRIEAVSASVGSGLNIKTVYGAKGDARQVTDAAITMSTQTLTSATAAFASADVGKSVIVRGAGARTVTDGAITAGLKVLTSATAVFTSADVGKAVVVNGAGSGGAALNTQVSSFVNGTTVNLSAAASTTVTGATTRVGENLETTISGYTNATTVTLTAAATTTVSAATMTFGTLDTAAFLAAAAGGQNIYIPSSSYFVAGIVGVTATGQRWNGDGKRSLIYQTTFGRMLFDVSADETHFENLAFAYPHAKTARPAWTYAEKSAPTNTFYNHDSTISRSAFIYAYGPSRVKLTNLWFENVYCGIRMRSTDRFSTQASDNTLRNIFVKDFQFGVIYMNQINGVVDGIHGAGTDSTDTAPPHLIYCAGAGAIPEDVTVIGTAITSVAATDLISTVGGGAHYLNAGDTVAFNELTGGAGLASETLYYVIASGLTVSDFKVSTTPGGASIDHTTNITVGEVTAYPDLDEDGDSDFANGTPDTVNYGGSISNCTDRDNPWSFSFKIRNCRGVTVSNLTSYDSAGVLQASWNQGMEFSGIRGVFLKQILSQSTGLAIDTGTQVAVQVNYSSHCTFKGLYLHTIQGQFVSGLGVRNNSRLNVFDHPHCDWTYGANTGNRSPYRLVDSNDNVYIEPSWDSKGFDRAGFYFFRSDNNRVVDPRVTHATPSWQKMLNFDADSASNRVLIDPEKLNLTTVTLAGIKVDVGAGNTVVKRAAASPATDHSLRYAPAGAIAQTLDRRLLANAGVTAFASGTLYLSAVWLEEGQLVTGASFYAATAPTTLTGRWYALYSPARAKLVVTADDATAFAADTEHPLPFASTYLAPAAGLYYVGYCEVAATVTALRGYANRAISNVLPPATFGASTAALTNAASAPATAAALSATSFEPYAYLY